MENSLSHHGIVGMKWGVRRYQNRDGTLTAAGKKRYDKEYEKLKDEQRVLKNKEATKAKLDKLNALKEDVDQRKKDLGEASKNKKPSDKSEPAKKSVKDMSDAELQAVVNRLNLEKRYSDLNPEKVSLGRRIVNRVSKDVLAPVATEVGKTMLKQAIAKSVSKDLAKEITKKQKDK